MTASAARATAALVALAAALGAAACLQLIAPYDEQTERETFAAARAIDQFYGELLEARPDARRYAKFSERYVAIESDLLRIPTNPQPQQAPPVGPSGPPG